MGIVGERSMDFGFIRNYKETLCSRSTKCLERNVENLVWRNGTFLSIYYYYNKEGLLLDSVIGTRSWNLVFNNLLDSMVKWEL